MRKAPKEFLVHARVARRLGDSHGPALLPGLFEEGMALQRDGCGHEIFQHVLGHMIGRDGAKRLVLGVGQEDPHHVGAQGPSGLPSHPPHHLGDVEHPADLPAHREQRHALLAALIERRLGLLAVRHVAEHAHDRRLGIGPPGREPRFHREVIPPGGEAGQLHRLRGVARGAARIAKSPDHGLQHGSPALGDQLAQALSGHLRRGQAEQGGRARVRQRDPADRVQHQEGVRRGVHDGQQAPFAALERADRQDAEDDVEADPQ